MADSDTETAGAEGPAGPAPQDVALQEFENANGQSGEDTGQVRSAGDLEPVFDVPVSVQAVLGRSNLEVSQLLKLAPGAVLELDRKVGEAIDIYVNNRLVARGEVVLVEDHLGVTMTEIIKHDKA